MTMAAYLLLPLFLSLLISTSNGEQSQIADFDSPKNCSVSDNYLACEVEELKLKVARMELLLEVTTRELSAKTNYIESCEKKIEEMNHNIHQLESVLSNLKVQGLSDDNEQMLNALEEKVQELETGVRKNDWELRLLEASTKHAENSVALLHSQLKMMSNVVPELWFHVQKLEQAQEVIQRRTAELRKHLRNQNCSFFRFINKSSGNWPGKWVSTFISETVNQLRRPFSALKRYHHLLQDYIRQEMEKNELTALLVDDELIFLLASIVIIFPVMFVFICWHPPHH